MIEIKNLHYSYGKITALRGINLAANSGEITAIIERRGKIHPDEVHCRSAQAKYR